MRIGFVLLIHINFIVVEKIQQEQCYINILKIMLHLKFLKFVVDFLSTTNETKDDDFFGF